MRLELRDDHGRIVAQIDARGHCVGTVAPQGVLEAARVILNRAISHHQASVDATDLPHATDAATHPVPPTDPR